MDNSVTAIYFSPTYTSRKGACTIAKALNNTYNELDLTCQATKAQFGKNDIVVFSAPVYGGRLFKGFIERLNEIQGSDTPCVVTVTYGNCDYDDALLEFCNLVTAKGFIPVAAAALIGQHTYGSIQVGRPNKDDLAEDTEFAKKVAEKLKNNDYCPMQAIDEDNRTICTDKCISCFRCIRRCPVGAKHMDVPAYNEFAAMFTEKLKTPKTNTYFI